MDPIEIKTSVYICLKPNKVMLQLLLVVSLLLLLLLLLKG